MAASRAISSKQLSGRRQQHQRFGITASASASATCKTELEQETEVTDAIVEQQGESKRRREHPEAPQAADSSTSSSTDTEMGSVDVCTILCGNSERATGKPVGGCRRV